MKKVIFHNRNHLKLVGHFWESDSDSIIIFCHGFTSDKSARGRFDRLAVFYHGLGYAVLAFDFSGCGESDDVHLTLANRIIDLYAAISYVQAQGYRRIVLHGHSLGTCVCLSCYTPVIDTMILTGALTGPMFYDWEQVYSKQQIQALRREGYITEVQAKRDVMIDKQMLLDFEQIDQEKLLSHVKCPVLIIHGDGDQEERALYQNSQRGLKWLPEASKLEVIQGATHSFTYHLSQIEHLAKRWLHFQW
ncbi:alpha/beta hydrolase [Hazenella sp. IB182357]|uniref:Alpha/beta hydrolase n=1 Tax=Polycladospora coralii TaxID=2771432 RepID=A0A926NH89_9BACL|nr:alpha/beta hydrolase [Polycladospora coralii]MBD1373524.1 alpha/beta hydrolase [Polycladospora coralii]MBS7531892.1 alpha/beta hydrolase [Polycladospora coralii]